MTEPTPPLVLSVLHSLEPGGVERDVLRFTRAWRENGLDARIALGRWEGALEAEAPDVPYIIPAPTKLARIETESLWMILKLPAIIKSVKPDVLVFASNGLMAVAVAMRLRFGKDCPPMVLRISNSLNRPETGWLSRTAHRWLLRLHSRIYTAIVAMAPPLRDEIIHEMGAAPERVITIENAALTAADAQRLRDARDHARPAHVGRHFLAIGRLSSQKNFPLLLEAFARIARPEDRLAILGEGADRASLTALAEKLGIAGQLQMPGQVQPVDQWFGWADAFVLSSDFEGVPAVLVEALAAGIPIVATNCAVSIPMMVEGAGRLVPPRNVNALAQAMDAICNDSFDPQTASIRAERFTVEATLAKWVTLLRQAQAN